jgi:hypothetical protein
LFCFFSVCISLRNRKLERRHRSLNESNINAPAQTVKSRRKGKSSSIIEHSILIKNVSNNQIYMFCCFLQLIDRTEFSLSAVTPSKLFRQVEPLEIFLRVVSHLFPSTGRRDSSLFFFSQLLEKRDFERNKRGHSNSFLFWGKKTNKNDGQCELGSWWGLGCFRGVLLCGPSSLKHTHGEMARSLRKAF